MMRREYIWEKAERITKSFTGEFDAADLVIAARKADWWIGVQYAKRLLLELSRYGLLIQVRAHAFRSNTCSPQHNAHQIQHNTRQGVA